MYASRIVFAAAIGLLAAPLVAAPPKVSYLFPAGGQRGTETIVTASGEFPVWPVEVWCDRPGVSAKAEPDKGKLRVTIADETPPGIGWLRFHSADGASSLRPFLVDQLPELAEAEPNDTPHKPQNVASEQVINGRLGKAGDVDAYAVTLSKGSTLVASLQAHSILGSPLDGVLQICELRERTFSSIAGAPAQVEAYVLEQKNDWLGLDPRVVATAPRDGVYLVRVMAFSAEPNSTIGFAGGDEHVYRLTLSTHGFADHALPVAGNDDNLQLFGPGLTDTGIAAERAGVTAFAKAIAGWTPAPPAGSLLIRGGEPLVLETISKPICVVGRLQAASASHEIRFVAKKGETFDLTVRSRALGYLPDIELRIADAAGKVLHQADDTDKQADPRQAFTAPADGTYTVRVRDLHRRGGVSFVYWLEIAPGTPSLALSLAADNFTLARGKTVEVPVTVTRKRGHKGPLAVNASGIDNGALPPGVTATLVTSQGEGESAKSVKLVLTAAADAPLGGAPIQIVGRESEGATPVIASLPSGQAYAEPPPIAWLTVIQP